MTTRDLTRSQREALRIAAVAALTTNGVVYRSTANEQESWLVAAGSAAKLIDLGLMEPVGTRYGDHRVKATPTGIALALALHAIDNPTQESTP